MDGTTETTGAGRQEQPGAGPDQPGAGLRERKKLATRQALALATVQLAIERGLENVRVEDITRAVNVSRRTFTNYFASKEEAIASVSADRFARAAQALRDRPASEPLADSLAEVFAAQHQAADQLDRGRMAPIRMLMSSPALQGEVLKTMVAAERPLAEVIAERTGTDPQHDLRTQVLAASVMAAVQAATALWGTGDGSLPDMIRQAVRQVAERPTAGADPRHASAPAPASPGSKSQ